MRKFLALVLAMATFAVASCEKENKETPYNPDGSPITQEQALEIVKEDIDMYDVVYVSKSIVKKGTKFKTLGHEGRVPIDSWVVMINTEPQANSGPFWLYIYVDAYTGNADRDSWEWGDTLSFEWDVVKSQYVDSSLTMADSFPGLSETRSSSAVSVSNNWAVIISGGHSPQNNYERYWNDCSAIYKCLRQVHGYRKDRIFVLMSDGTSSGLDRRIGDNTYASSPLDLDGDGVGDIDYSATKSNISTVFNKLKNNVSADEQVLVFVTDHGGKEKGDKGESYIVLWNNTMISATDFAKEVAKINSSSRKHVVLGQCYSGGFIGPLSYQCSNISIAAASEADKVSWAMSSGEYEEFLYHWISAAAGTSPDGAPIYADQNGYDGVSVEEVFKYAKESDVEDEHPQYSSTPEPMGEKYGLSGTVMGYPALTGPRHISSNPINGTFSLTNIPDVETYSMNWVSNDKISVTPLSPSSATARSVSVIAIDRDWIRAELTTPFKTYSLKWWTHLWRPGTTVSADLISGSLVDGYLSLPYYVEGTDDYDWYISCPDYEHVQSFTYFIDFTYTGDGNPGPYYVSVSFLNPLGEQTTIIRNYD